MAGEITHVIGPGPRQLKQFGNVPVPILFGNDQITLESGAVLVAKKASDDGDISASGGKIIVPAGLVVVKKTGEDVWKPVDAATDADTDGIADIVAAAQAVGILKHTADLANGSAPVGLWIGGGFIAARMPKVADWTTIGLEAAVIAALKLRGFRFAEDYH